MALAIRHRARLEPTIKHFVDAMQCLASLERLDFNVVDILAVQVINLLSTALLQLLDTANHLPLFLVLADPNRNGCSPVSVPRHRPIPRVHQPIMETLVFDIRRHPVRLLIVGHQLFLDRSHADKPRWNRFVQQRSIRSPAHWILVIEIRLVPQSAVASQIFDNLWVCIEHVLSRIVLHLVGKPSIVVDRTHNVLFAAFMNICILARSQIVFTKARSLMDNACTFLLGDIVIGNHAETMLSVSEILKQRLIRLAH
mmetsp:Transcript_63551/g.101144  ORF Transcript_63551/g.101144 Transcript_63551/m.101144 type:complete len:255 (-) Transcript_63551:613-1377(-)